MEITPASVLPPRSINGHCRRDWTLTGVPEAEPDWHTYNCSSQYPMYLAASYESYDIMHLSEVPFQRQRCKDMTPEFQKK
jgi:hypothetical protein